jgi:hypothetical protein
MSKEIPVHHQENVHRLLVTGDIGHLTAFNLEVYKKANAIRRIGQTVLYTVMDENLDDVIATARKTQMTVQQMQPGSEEEWATVVRGDARPWELEAPRLRVASLAPAGS